MSLGLGFSVVQCVTGFSMSMTGVVAKIYSRPLGGSLLGAGLVLAIQSIVQLRHKPADWQMNREDSDTCLRLRQIACLAVGTSFSALCCQNAMTYPAAEKAKALVVAMTGVLGGVMLTNAVVLYNYCRRRESYVPILPQREPDNGV